MLDTPDCNTELVYNLSNVVSEKDHGTERKNLSLIQMMHKLFDWKTFLEIGLISAFEVIWTRFIFF